MAEVKWIKITTDVFDDEKILLIESMPSADSIITIWFKLLILAGKQNNNGVFMMSNKLPFTDEMLATIFRRDLNTVRLALKTFEEFGMIEVVDNVITIPNWNKHQTLDAYEKKKERDRLYQQNRRKKQKNLIEQKSLDKSSDVAVSDKEEEKEEDKEKENTKESSPVERFADFVAAYPKACTGYLVETEYCNAVAAGVPEEDLITAARNYAVACRKKKTPVRYIKNPENFLKENLFMAYVKGADDGSTDEKNDKRDAGTHEKSLNELLAERGISGEFEGF